MRPNGLNTIDDFVTNDLFIEWVLSPNEENITMWAGYLADYPEKIPVIESAKKLVLELHAVESITVPQVSLSENWKAIVQKTTRQPIKKEPIIRSLNWWKYAASVASIFLLGFLGVNYFQNPPKNSKPLANKTIPKCEWKSLKNTTAIAKTITLNDGSKVILEPFSTLKYPTCFVKNQREVVLKGEAFFDIKRDTTKPFVVYANETITKVLGTSFTIKAFEGEKEVEVAVKTGKVAVYAKVNSLPKKTIKASEKFVIRTDEQILIPIPNKKLEVTPNQTVIFDKVNAEMQKMVSKLPLPVKPVNQFQRLKFDAEPLPIVFEALGKAYGLEINYDENLANCLITTKLEEVSIFNRLDIICQAMDLEYTETEASIYVSGAGCD